MICALALAFLTSASASARAQPNASLGPTFQTSAPYAILMDAETRTVLLERAGDDLMAPASLAKIATAAVVFEEIRQGRLSLDDEFVISENAWRRGGGPSGGSAMFAILKSKVKIGDLLRGLIVQSGNDAAIALAEGVAGSEAAFAQRMNDYMRKLGLTKSVFRNASGMGDPAQKTTARELAILSLHVIETYPDLYKIFGEKEFTWNKIRQLNRNPLLTMGIGADGLKTGNIAESGFGLVGSAAEDGHRLVVVLNGLKSARERELEGRRILDWGLRSFESRRLFAENEVIGEARTYGGAKFGVPVTAGRSVRLLAPRGSSERLQARVVYQGPVRAPVAKGAEIGRLRVMRGEVQALDLPVYAAEDVDVGPLTRRAADAVLEQGVGWVRGLFRKAN